MCLAADDADLVLQLNGLYDAALDGNPVVVLTTTRSAERRQTSSLGGASANTRPWR